MNIFLPYEKNILASVQALDDARLNKQAVECYQLLTSAIKEKSGDSVKGHSHHPVYVFYKDNLAFLAYYGYLCCCEYMSRFDKMHKLFDYFSTQCSQLLTINTDFITIASMFGIYLTPEFVPYYMEGSITDPDCIRTTKNVSALFQQKLIKKWEQDKANGRNPKWTNRHVPEFYSTYLKVKTL